MSPNFRHRSIKLSRTRSYASKRRCAQRGIVKKASTAQAGQRRKDGGFADRPLLSSPYKTGHLDPRRAQILISLHFALDSGACQVINFTRCLFRPKRTSPNRGLYYLRSLNKQFFILRSFPIGIVTFSTLIGLLGAPHPAGADLRFTPSLTVSEAYDSNVLFISGGSDKDDFVTTVSPAITATYRGRPVEGTLTAGMGVSTYAKHSDFNYVSATGALALDLTQLVKRLDNRATLTISDTVYYAPELPAFVTNTVGLNPFSTGVQPQRVQTLTNTLSVTGGYTLTSRVNLNAGYSYSLLDFGNTVGAPEQTALFGTTIHSANAGPVVKLTTADTLTLQALYSNAEFHGGAGSFHTEGGTVGLTHSFSPQLTATVAGGATLVSPSNRVEPLANLSVSWSERNTTATLSYSRSISPSFTIGAGALTSDIVSLAVTHRFTDRLTGTAGANYARSSSVASSASGTSGSDVTFDSYTANFSLNYSIRRWLSASFSYAHSHFDQGFSDATSSFSRDLVTLSLTATWL